MGTVTARRAAFLNVPFFFAVDAIRDPAPHHATITGPNGIRLTVGRAAAG
ncbi:hypothetical protein [Actinomadura meridiana]